MNRSREYFPNQEPQRCGCFFPDSILTHYIYVTHLPRGNYSYEAVFNCRFCGIQNFKVKPGNISPEIQEEIDRKGIAVLVKAIELEDFRKSALEKIQRNL